MATRAATQCEQCGGVDDHPKAHWQNGPTYHHDCIPFSLKQELIASGDKVASIIEAAESGKRGKELLNHIKSLHGESN